MAQIAETCEWVLENPPRTFLEAVQFFYFIHLIRYLEFSTVGIGVRLDILLVTFFENDLKAGRITREEALEILQLLWIKFMELGFVYSPMLTSVSQQVSAPSSSVTHNVTVKTPELAYTCDGVAPDPDGEPSPKSHS